MVLVDYATNHEIPPLIDPFHREVLHEKELEVEKRPRAINEKALFRRATRRTRKLLRATYQVALSQILNAQTVDAVEDS